MKIWRNYPILIVFRKKQLDFMDQLLEYFQELQ